MRMLLFLCDFSGEFLECVNEFADTSVSCDSSSPLVAVVDVIDVRVDAFFKAFDDASVSGFNDTFGPFEFFGVRVFEVLFVTFVTLDGGCAINGVEFFTIVGFIGGKSSPSEVFMDSVWHECLNGYGFDFCHD